MYAFLKKHTVALTVVFMLVTIALIGVSGYQYRALTTLQTTHTETLKDLETAKSSLNEKESALSEYTTNLEALKSAYALSEENGSNLLEELTAEKERNEAFEKQINRVTGTVNKLDKLSQLDPELLMKYSKVYFLNEHYAPENTAEIASSSRFKKDEPEFIDAKVAPFLEDLLKDATEAGITLEVVSGYRSFSEQRSLKNTYSVQYGSGANTFSADQGYSEHQLGTTIDFTTPEIGGGLTGFETSVAYTWLLDNAYKHGFVLSYPKDNAYYVFEPWHWRFVGEKLARHLYRAGQFFYDMDQREIDTYLISIFD